jgi:hypothetical protein
VLNSIHNDNIQRRSESSNSFSLSSASEEILAHGTVTKQVIQGVKDGYVDTFLETADIVRRLANRPASNMSVSASMLVSRSDFDWTMITVVINRTFGN